MSKAFDTIDHKILLSKFEHYRIRGNVVKWFESYLTSRYHFVKFNNTTSNFLPVRHEVPQGSILVPLLFLLYTNDLPNISESLYFITFADDTNIFIRNKCKQKLHEDMNIELNKLAQWMKINRLSLNINKTKAMLFTYKNDTNNLAIKVENTNIEFVNHIKLLGIILGNKLKWDYHIQYISNKISKIGGIFNKIRYKMSRNTFISLYYSLV